MMNKFQWKKLGLITDKLPENNWSKSHMQFPAVLILDDVIRVFVSTRPNPESDGKNVTLIRSFDLDKNSLFTVNERIQLIEESISPLPSVEVNSFYGLMVEHAKKHSAVAAIRGLRVLSDFEFEFKMALMNRSLNDDISTVFLMPHSKYTHISSSMVREVASLGGDVSGYVPCHVNDALKRKYE